MRPTTPAKALIDRILFFYFLLYVALLLPPFRFCVGFIVTFIINYLIQTYADL